MAAVPKMNYTITIPSHLLPPNKEQEPVNVSANDSAPFFSRFFMILREIPSYLSTARTVRFKEGNEGKNIFQQYVMLIVEILVSWPSNKIFQKNIEKLEKDFAKITNSIEENNKPICAYLVSSYDKNGAVLGDHPYYYHHYKINEFEKHYAVAAKVFKTPDDRLQFLKQLKEKYPQRDIEVIDIVAHGAPDRLGIKKPNGEFYASIDVRKDEFIDCAKDARIILDACSTGKGSQSIAEKIARMNPRKTVIAPGSGLFFSKPIISEKNGRPSVEHVVYGLANPLEMVSCCSARKFKYSH